MKYTHYHQFDGMKEEIALVCHYDYEPEEPAVYYPVDDAYPGCAEAAVISQVCFNIAGSFSDVTGMIDDEFMAELEEACLEDFRSVGAE